MNSLLEKNLISTKDASLLSGYNPDYLARLCRAGKIDGARVGRAWLVSQESLEAFVKDQEVRKQELRETLSEMRGQEYQHAQNFSTTTQSDSVTFDKASLHGATNAVDALFTTPFQKRSVALLAALVVMLAGVYGAQAQSLGAIGNSALATALNITNGFDTIVGSEIQHADDQATQEVAAAKNSTPSPLVAISASSTRPSQQLVNALTTLALSQSPRIVSLASSSFPYKTDSTLVPYSQSVTLTPAPVSSQNLAEVVGNAALSLGINIRDTGRALPFVFADNEVAAAVAFSHFSDDILKTYSDGVYAWVDETPAIPAFLTTHAYDAGNRIANTVGAVPTLTVATFNTGINAWVVTTPEVATAIVEDEIAVGTAINAVSDQSVAAEETGVTAAGRLAYDEVSQGNHTIAQTPAALAYIQSATEDATLGLVGNASLKTQQTPGVVAKATGSLAAAIVPESTYGALQQAALYTGNFIHGLFADADNAFAFVTGRQQNLAVEPNLYVLPPAGTSPSGYTLPTTNVTTITSSATTSAPQTTTHSVTNVTSNTIVQGVSESYVDDSITNLRTMMLEQVDSLASNLGRNSGGGGTTIINNTTGGGTTLASSSDVSIDSVTANTGSFGSLAVTGSTTLNSLAAATSTFNGDVTINGTLNVSSISGFSGGGSATSVAPYFTATSTTATSSFAGNVAVTGNTSLSTTSVTNLTATNATSTNLFATLAHATTGIFDNLFATLATITNLTSTNSTSTNATSTNLYAANSKSTNGYISQLTSDNAVLTAATSTNLFASLADFGSISVGSLNGFLKATNGSVSTSLISLASDITGTLPVANGGTGSTTLTGILKGNGTGSLISAIAGTDYQAPITLTTTGTSGAATFTNNTLNIPQYSGTAYTGTYPIQISGSSISLAFGTTTSNTWGGTQTFTNSPIIGTLTGFVAANNGALYQIASSSLDLPTTALASQNVSQFTNDAGYLTPSWTTDVNAGNGTLSDVGTLAFFNSATELQNITDAYGEQGLEIVDGFSPSNHAGLFPYYQDGGAPFQAGDILIASSSGNYYAAATSSLNIALTDTSGTLGVARGGTGSTTLTGILKGNGTGGIQTAVGGTDYEFPLTFSFGLNRTGNSITNTGVTSLTNSDSSLTISGSTGAVVASLNPSHTNTFTALQQFYGGASTTAFSANTASFGTTATSSFAADGTLTLAQALGQSSGGTGYSTYTPGSILYADGSGNLQELPIGSNGQVLKIAAGLPGWGVDLTTGSGGGGDGIFGTTTSGVVYPLDTSNPVVIGSNATATPNSIFEVSGQQYISSKLGIATTVPATTLSVGGSGYFTGGLGVGILNTIAGTLQTSGNATIGGTLSVGSLTGLLRATGGVVSTSLVNLASDVSGVLPIANGGTGTSTTPSYGNLLIGNSTGGYSLTATSSLGLLTTNVAEGTNLYFTNARADARINATSTIGTLTSAPNLGTVNTSLTGFLKATAGALSTSLINLTSDVSNILPVANGGTGTSSFATNGVVYGNNTGGLLTTAQGGTNTVLVANNGAPSFSSNLTVTSITTTGASNLATTGGSVGIGTTSPATTLSVAGNGYFTGGLGVGTVNTTAGSLVAIGNANVGSLTVGTLTGFLKAAGGVVSTAAVNLTSDISGVLPVGNGGTGWAAIQSGAIPYGNASGALATTTAGTNGQVLAFLNGIPSWTASTTFSSGLAYLNGNVTNTGLLSITGTANQITASASTGAVTLSLPSQLSLTNASSTNLTASGYINAGSLTIGSLNGILYGNNGAVTAATVNSPLSFTGGALSLGTVGVANGGTGSTTLTGILKGNGTGGVLSAVAGVDYLVSALTSIGPVGQSLTGPAITIASSTASFNGLTLGLQTVGSTNTLTNTPTISGTLNNAGLTNSSLTVSGGSGLSGGGSVALGGSTTITLNLANANTWTALQQFSAGASTTQLTSTGNAYLATTGGSVGVGTTSPSATFAVQGTNAAAVNTAAPLAVALIGGNGLNGTSGVGGAGGGLTLLAGNGATNTGSSATSGAGGSISIIAGLGGTGTIGIIGAVTPGAGGALTLSGGSSGTAGDGGNGTGGAVTITGGTGQLTGGALNLAAGAALTGLTSLTGGNGAQASLSGGAGGPGNSGPGNSSSGGNGGNLLLAGGNGGLGSFSANGNGGNVYLYGGTGTSVGNVFLAVTSGGTATGKVGIGTTTPLSTLTVVGSACYSEGVGTASVLCGTTAGNTYAKLNNLGNYDVAEDYTTTDPTAVPGTIVAIDSTNAEAVRTATTGSTILGAVSTAPGVLLGGADALAAGSRVAIALSGRTPVQVSLQGGPIAIGDRIALSSTPGVGMKATQSGQTIGIALEPATTPGEIDVFVQPSYYFAPSQLSIDSTSGNITVGSTLTSASLVTSGLAVTGNASASSYEVANAASSFTNTFGTFGLGSTTAASVLSYDGTGVDLYKLATFTLSNVQQLATQTATIQTQVNNLEIRVTALEAGATAGLTNASSSPSSDLLSATTTQLASALESVGVLLQDGIAQFNTLVVRDLVFSKDADGTSAAGSGTILAGNTVVDISNDHMLATAQVSITPTSAITGNWYISQKADGSFRVTLSQVQSNDFTFDYLIIQTSGQIATSTPTGYVGNPFSWISALFDNSSSTTTTPPANTPTPTTGSTTSATSTPNGIASSTPNASAPVVTLNGAAAISLTQGDIFTDPGATAVDSSGNDISSSIVESGSVDTNTPGIYTLTYTATDATGNTGTVSRVVTVAAVYTSASGSSSSSTGSGLAAPATSSTSASGSSSGDSPSSTSLSSSAVASGSTSATSASIDSSAAASTGSTSGSAPASTDSSSSAAASTPAAAPVSDASSANAPAATASSGS